MDSLFVQYGCGWSAPPGWVNFDSSPTLRYERIPLLGRLYTKNPTRFPDYVQYGDIVRGLPLEDKSCRAVYCSHVLEHLSLEGFRKALINTNKILEHGGIFRCVLPDLEYAIANYTRERSPRSAPEFVSCIGMGQESEFSSLKDKVLKMFGNSRHLWMWDYSSIEHELKHAGFRDIRRARFNDSNEPMFLKVEEEIRWQNALGVECVR